MTAPFTPPAYLRTPALAANADRAMAWADQANQPNKMLLQVEALRAACDRALLGAQRGNLFETVEGYRLVNAAFDLFECDDLYTMAKDVAHDAGISAEPDPTGDLADWIYDQRRADEGMGA